MGHVVFGWHAWPPTDAALLTCRACRHGWLDNGERCAVGLFSDVLVPSCPQCGSVQVSPVMSKRV